MPVLRRRWLLVVVSAVSCVAFLGPVPARAGAAVDYEVGPVIAAGRLVTASGVPAETPVILTAWPTATDLRVGDEVRAPEVAQ